MDTRGFVGAVVHPDYVPLTNGVLGQTLGENDVAVLILAEDAPVEPVWFRTEPLKEHKTETRPRSEEEEALPGEEEAAVEAPQVIKKERFFAKRA